MPMPQHPQLNLEERLAINLVDQFKNAAFIHDWLHHIMNLISSNTVALEATQAHAPLPITVPGRHVGRIDSIPKNGTKGSLRGVYPLAVQPCIVGSVYGLFGIALSKQREVDEVKVNMSF